MSERIFLVTNNRVRITSYLFSRYEDSLLVMHWQPQHIGSMGDDTKLFKNMAMKYLTIPNPT